MRVLIGLAESAPQPVTRDCLLEKAWPDLYTSEHSLTTVISELRKVFEDDPRRPRIIETIRKVGYRLMVPPHPHVTEPAAIQRPQTPRRLPYRLLRWVGFGLLAIFAIGFWGRDLPKIATGTDVTPIPRPLTTYPGGEFDPALSPDGRSLAFVWTGTDDNLNIYLKDLDGESPRKLTDAPGFEGSPVWSPDGKYIAYMASEPGDCGIFMTSVTGGDVRRLADCGNHDESALDWSPDGRRIVFADQPHWDSPSRLNLIDLESGTVSQLTHPSNDLAGDRDPAFSPDGRLIVFVRGTIPSAAAPEISPFFGDLFTIDLDTRAVAQVTHGNMEIPGVAWRRDGQKLVFASNCDGGGYGLWEVPAQGGAPQHLMRGSDLVRNPLYASSTQLIYEDWQRDSNIWKLDLERTDAGDTVHPKSFIVSTKWESHPEYSPDGRRIAFASKRSGSTEIWICDAEGGHLQKVTDFGGAYVNAPRWSPDGGLLAFEVRSQGQSQIFTQSLQPNSAPRQMTFGQGYQMAPSWSQDGRSLYFGSNRNGAWQIWRLNLKGIDPELVTPGGGFQAFEFGEHLYFSQMKRLGIWRQPLAGGQPELMIQRTVPQDWGNWTVHSQGIYYIKRLSVKRAALCFHSFSNGEEGELIQFESHRVLGKNGLTVSPDGKWALFSKLDRLTGDLMILEGL